MKIQFVTVNQNSFDKGDGVTRDMEYIPSLGGFGRVSVNVNGKDQPEKRLYIIPHNLFNAKNIEESLKYNIVKKVVL